MPRIANLFDGKAHIARQSVRIETNKMGCLNCGSTYEAGWWLPCEF